MRAPLRRHDLPPITDGACAVVIARADKARRAVRATRCGSPASPTAPSCHNPALRDLTDVAVDHARGRRPPGSTTGPVEVAELQAAFTHEEPLLRRGARARRPTSPVNPSGGPLAANPIMATGLVRIAEAARQIRDGDKQRTLAHSTSGPCLQQNLVCILEGDS